MAHTFPPMPASAHTPQAVQGPKIFTTQLFVQLHAGHARWFAVGHAGDGRGDG